MKYLIVLTVLIVFTFFNKSLGYTNASPLWTHFTYMFQHANLIHLLINSLAFIGMFRILEKIINKYILLATILSIGFLTSFLSMYEIPTVGASSMVYAMIGIFFGSTISRRIKIADIKKYLLFILGVALSLTVSFFKPNSNFELHIYSMLFGLIPGTLSLLKSNAK